MELSEAGRRIFRRHWALILLLTLAGLLLPVALERYQDTEYSAAARITLGQDPRDAEAANGLADTARALATSPAVLRSALDQAQAERRLGAVADAVEVNPVGNSGVLVLTVTDSERDVAAALASSLATSVVEQRERALVAGIEQLRADIETQIAGLTERITALETQMSNSSGTTLDTLRLQYADAATQRTDLNRQRQQLIHDLATVDRPAVVDASSTGQSVPTGPRARMIVGGLLGLVVGVALASLREALRPALDRAALARHLAVPLLGSVRFSRESDAMVEDPWLADYVTVAADKAGVRSVQLVPVGRRPVRVAELARSLDRGEGGARGDGVSVDALVLPGGPQGNDVPPDLPRHDDTGIVVVAPKVVKGMDLSRLERHLQVTGQPVIGLITYRGRPPAAARDENTEMDAEYLSALERGAEPLAAPSAAPPAPPSAAPSTTPSATAPTS